MNSDIRRRACNREGYGVELADSSKGSSSSAGNSPQEGEKQGIKQVGEYEKQLIVVNVAHNEVVEGTEESSPCQTDSLKKDSVNVEAEASMHKDSEDATTKNEDLRENQAECSPSTNFGLETQTKVEEPDSRSINRSSPEEENVKSNFDLEVGLDVSNKAIQEDIQKEPEQIISLIVSEPIQVMAWRVHELPERSVVCLKETTGELIVKEDNKGKLCALQEVLLKRSDLNLETLLKSHRAQLQILVAIKTGLPEFVQLADVFTSSDLAEIFLNLKCRNINCRSALPVDECDCRFCSRKDGFCSSCMCLICSKFDTASNTCGWIGCDLCIHWCHTNCALLNSYIRNGRSVSGGPGVSEMQFYCVSCEHPSEMFGFVKDVFKTCAAEWKTEILLNELEYVKNIFSASNDNRGRYSSIFNHEREVKEERSPARARSSRSKAFLKWMFIVLNVLVEICQAVLSQEAAQHKMSRQIYLTLSIITCSVCLIMSLLDVFHQGRSSEEVRRTRGYGPGLRGLSFGKFLLYFGIICSMVQLVVNLTAKITKKDFIKFDYVPLLLSVCQLAAAMVASRVPRVKFPNQPMA